MSVFSLKITSSCVIVELETKSMLIVCTCLKKSTIKMKLSENHNSFQAFSCFVLFESVLQIYKDFLCTEIMNFVYEKICLRPSRLDVRIVNITHSYWIRCISVNEK